MVDYALLGEETVELFSRLTFPSYRQFLGQKVAQGRYIAIGASLHEKPVGLVLAQLLEDERAVELLSVAVFDAFKCQGIGSALLARLEKECLRLGYNTISAFFGTTLKSRPAVERLLAKNGWRSPRLAKIDYLLPKETFLENMDSWSQRQTQLPPGFAFCLWGALTAEQEASLKQLVRTDPRYARAILPKKKTFDPRFSMAVLCEGQVVAWQMVYEIDENILQYSKLFVREDLRKYGLALAMQAEISRLQFEQKLSHRYIGWAVDVDNSFMRKFVENFLAPFNPVTNHFLESRKQLVLAQGPVEPQFKTLTEALDYRAEQEGAKIAYTFLLDGEEQAQELTYRELAAESRRLAERLRFSSNPGDRILLCLPSGLPFIKAFFASLYAGLVAVPAAPPDPLRLNKTLPRLQAIIKDAQPALAITTPALLSEVKRFSAISGSAGPRWLSIESLQSTSLHASDLPAHDPASLAFLMYTSGSTADPKGVMVDHASALYNLANFPGFIERPLTGVVSWLPFFHDLGLFLGLLHPLYRGVPAVLMDPLAFVQRPARWLQAISRYRCSATGGPNFAYELCAQKVTPQDRAKLDLSCWNLALNGAEPVRAETLQRFIETFEPADFSAYAFYPSYGLAEAPCTVTGGYFYERPYYLAVDREALSANRYLPGSTDGENNNSRLVGCGGPLPGQRLAIVDPATFEALPEGHTGEIWVGGPGIPRGYWRRPEENQKSFQARLACDTETPYLRTGDLGFWQDGELFITGRLKDLIIIRGRNYYPQDIEKTVEQCHPAIRKGCQGAFALDVAGEERAVVVCEVNANAPLEEVVAAIRQAVSEKEEVNLYGVTLLPPGSLPKTSSGKLQRQNYRTLFITGKLTGLYEWREDRHTAGLKEEKLPEFAPRPYSLALAIEDQLVYFVHQRLGLDSSQVDVRKPLSDYFEIDNQDGNRDANWQAVLEAELSPLLPENESFGSVLNKYATIEGLSRHLAGLPAPATVEGQVAPATLPDPVLEPIAIVGMSCRFPGAENLAEFWQLLSGGEEALGEIPPERWDIELFYDPDPTAPGKMISRRGGFLKNIDRFDPFFFGISPHEAPQTDPRQRLLLETAWEALEDAGIAPDSLSGSQAGVYIADLNADYGSLLFNDFGRIDAYSGPGAANSVLANRLSYFLNLHGPSMAIDTACSGSLVALHLACHSLRSGESALALVGGVNVILRPDASIFFSKARALSPDGRCKTFDASANGMVRSEGAGVMVLKLLSQAQQDGDRIYALVRGSAVNSDGHSKGLMAPDSAAQVAVMRQAYRQAALSPAAVQYIEAHGTGTAAGDPQELEALGILLREEQSRERLCAVGSVKSNIGHTEAAAGMAGLLKVALALKHRQLPASLHFRQPNPLASLEELPLVVQRRAASWPSSHEPLVAGVSSFGFGGTNAHVVLVEPPTQPELPPNPDQSPAHLLTLSARSEPALRDLAASFLEKLRVAEKVALPDLSFTLSQRRAHLSQRLAVSGTDASQLIERLIAYLDNRRAPGVSSGSVAGRPPRLVMVFSGQGSHWLKMGRELMDGLPVFRAKMEECDSYFQKYAGWSLLEELYIKPEETSRLASTDVMQPAIFALQVALAAVWQSWGVTPAAITGQSLGEIAAAHVAGALSLEEAVRVVFERSRLMKTTAGQGLTAV
ncbi:MAG TPA: GNAT family N-acetyltransferase, partial [Chloroflexia bacterium]|nr:GNAT family N-acetyltransferase [Chloroflexia bacterium]